MATVGIKGLEQRQAVQERELAQTDLGKLVTAC